MSKLISPYGFALVAILLVAVLYSNTFQHEYNLDDIFLLDHLPPPGSHFSEVLSVFDRVYDEADYRPMGSLLLALEQWTFGHTNSTISHVVNVILFWLASMMVFFSIRLFVNDDKSYLPVVITVLFIALPIHSNVVASMKNRDILISFIFGMMALNSILYLLNRPWPRRVLSWLTCCILLLFALASFLLGSLAKQDIISFAFIVPIAIFLRADIGSKWKPFIQYGILLLLPGLFFLLFKRFRFDYIAGNVVDAPAVENTIAVTENPLILDSSLISKLGMALTSVFYYIKFNVIPTGYYFYFGYDHVPTGSFFHLYNIIAIIAILIAIYIFFRNIKTNPLLSFGIGFFFVSLIYALNLYMPVAGIVAPRLGFIASAGYAIVLGSILFLLVNQLKANRKFNYSIDKMTLLLTMMLFVFYGIFTVQRNRAWKDIMTLIETDMPHLERSFEAQRIATGTYYNLIQQTNNPGVREARIRNSFKHAQLAHNVYDGDQYIEESLGLTLFYLGRKEESYKQLYSVTQRFPTSVSAWQILGELNASDKNYRSAATCYMELSKLLPLDPTPFIKTTQNMILAGEVEKALNFNKANVVNDPDAYYHYEGVGYTLLHMGDTISAVPYFLYGQDHNSPNKDYKSVFESYFRRNGLMEEWLKYEAGYRPPLGL